MNKLWRTGNPPKSGEYVVTYEETAFEGIRATKPTTKRHTTTLIWDMQRGWLSPSAPSDGMGLYGFAYPVLFWRRLPRPVYD